MWTVQPHQPNAPVVHRGTHFQTRPLEKPTSNIGVLGLLSYCGLQMADPWEADGSYEPTRVPDVDIPALNHLF